MKQIKNFNNRKEIINYTPHPVKIFSQSGMYKNFYSEGVARIDSTEEAKPHLEIDFETDIIVSVPNFTAKLGAVRGLPNPKKNTLLIVSRVVATALKGKRDDLIVPARLVRDEKGRIIGCKAFEVVE